jgi:hypothetical protein
VRVAARWNMYRAIKYVLASLVWSEEIIAPAVVTRSRPIVSVVTAYCQLRLCPSVQSDSDPSPSTDCVHLSNDSSDDNVAGAVGWQFVVKLNGELLGRLQGGSGHFWAIDLRADGTG